MGELFAILSLAFYSANAIITKTASGRLDLNTGFFISISVNVLFAGLLFAGQVMLGGAPAEFHGSAFVMFAAAGFFASYLGRAFFFDSIAKMGPAKATSFMVSNPLFTFLISWIFLGETLSGIELGGVLLVLFGLFLVSYIPAGSLKPLSLAEDASGVRTNGQKKWKNVFQAGVLMALVGSLSYALGNIIRGSAVQEWNEPILGGFLGALTGLVLHVLLNKQVRSLKNDLRNADTKAVWLYALTGVLTISAQIGQIAAMHYLPISIVTLIAMSQPLLVLPLSYFILKNQEGINFRVITGSLLVLAGISGIILY